jgi:hypothetical protein
MLLDDHVAPLRIILGYGGFETEHSLRQGFLNFIARNPKRPGFAGSSLPSLIVCGQNSIVKTNGLPFYLQPWGGGYLCYASSSHNPILWILNLILTRISQIYAGPRWYNRDLSTDRFTPLLWVKAPLMAKWKGGSTGNIRSPPKIYSRSRLSRPKNGNLQEFPKTRQYCWN